MQRIRSKLSSKGQLTLPLRVRNALGVEPEDQVIFVISDDGAVAVEPLREYSLEELDGIVPALARPTSPDFGIEIREAMDEAAERLVREIGGL